jgi:hypothetical protein
MDKWRHMQILTKKWMSMCDFKCVKLSKGQPNGKDVWHEDWNEEIHGL